MCRKHEPVYLFREPPAGATDLRLERLLRHLSGGVICTRCGLTGAVTAFGALTWYTPGTVGYRDRERDLARAAEWSARVAAAEGVS